MSEKGKEIKVNFPEELQKGVYANNMIVSHTKEEFVMDFVVVVPAVGTATVTARVITSPGHLKRIIAALQDNLRKYEENFGEIRESPPPGGKLH